MNNNEEFNNLSTILVSNRKLYVERESLNNTKFTHLDSKINNVSCSFSTDRVNSSILTSVNGTIFEDPDSEFFEEDKKITLPQFVPKGSSMKTN